MDADIRKKILTLLDQHRIMTIATLRPDGWPQATPFPRSDRRASHTSPTGPKHQTAAAAVVPPQALWKTRVLTSMLSRGSTLAGAVGSSKAECAVKRAVPSSAES